jgi:hypothetical protein
LCQQRDSSSLCSRFDSEVNALASLRRISSQIETGLERLQLFDFAVANGEALAQADGAIGKGARHVQC